MELSSTRSVGFDLVGGKIFGLGPDGSSTKVVHPGTEDMFIPMEEAVDRLCQATFVLVKAYADHEISRFLYDGGMNRRVVRALFNLGRS